MAQTYGVSQSLIDRGTRAQSQIEWLIRSQQWPGFQWASTNQANYVGKKILGAGGTGVAGLWEGNGRAVQSGRFPKHLVVKQTNRRYDDLLAESALLRQIHNTGRSEHVIKLYRAVRYEGGSGVTPRAQFDPFPFLPALGYIPAREVLRIYIEYCEGGDLQKKLGLVDQEVALSTAAEPTRTRRRPNVQPRIVLDPVRGDRGQNYFFPEEYVWRIMECLGKALTMLKHGSENTNANGPDWPPPQLPIIHFDIKPENILCGTNDNIEHKRLPIYKLADFGLARREPVIGAATTKRHTAWKDGTRWRATEGWVSPEQMYNRDCIGIETNVWSLGAVLYRIMTRELFQITTGPPAARVFHQNQFRTESKFLQLGNGSFLTFGEDLTQTPYSKRLIAIVHRCLAYGLDKRPEPRWIAREARRVVQFYDSIHSLEAPVNFGGPDTYPRDFILPKDPALDAAENDNQGFRPLTATERNLPANTVRPMPPVHKVVPRLVNLPPDVAGRPLLFNNAVIPALDATTVPYPFTRLGAQPAGYVAPIKRARRKGTRMRRETIRYGRPGR